MRFGKDKVQDAFREAVRTDLDALYRTACRMLYARTEAEDAVQESLGKAWRNLDRFKPDSRMRPWLFAILNNTCLDHLRARARRIDVPFDPESGQDLGLLSERDLPEEHVANKQLGRQIDDAIAALPPYQRAVVQLVIVEQLSYAEAAEALRLPLGTLRSRLSRARAALSAALSEHLDDPGERGTGPGRPANLKLVK